MRKAIEHFRHDDADRPVDRLPEQPRFGDPLVAEQIDERDRGQQRGCQDRDQRQGAKHLLALHATARDAVGVDEGQRNGDRRRRDRDIEAVGDRDRQRRAGEISEVIGEPDKRAIAVLEALGQKRPQRQRHEQDQPHHQPGQRQTSDDVVLPELGLDRVADEQGGDAGHVRPRADRRGYGPRGRAMESCLPSARSRSRIRLIEKSAMICAPPLLLALSVARQNEPRKSSPTISTGMALGVAAVTLRTLTSSGRTQARTLAPAACPSAGPQVRSVPPTRTRPGRRHHAVEEIHRADEIRHERRRGVAIDLHRRADLLDHAVVHHHDAVGHGQRLFLVMRHHDGGEAQPALQRADLVAQPHAHARIQRRQRLVQQQQARRGREGARQRHALLLTAGQLCGVFEAGIGHPHQPQQFLHPLGDVGAAHLAAAQSVADIVVDREIGEQRVGLEHDAEIAPRRRQRARCRARPAPSARSTGCRARRWRATAWSCRSPTGPESR